MHIQLIVEREQDNAVEEIRRINAVMVRLGYEGSAVFAEAYGADGLVRSLRFGPPVARARFSLWIAPRTSAGRAGVAVLQRRRRV